MKLGRLGVVLATLIVGCKDQHSAQSLIKREFGFDLQALTIKEEIETGPTHFARQVAYHFEQIRIDPPLDMSRCRLVRQGRCTLFQDLKDAHLYLHIYPEAEKATLSLFILDGHH